MRPRKTPKPQIRLSPQSWGRLGALERRPARATPSELETLADELLRANPDTNPDPTARVVAYTTRQMQTRDEQYVAVGDVQGVAYIEERIQSRYRPKRGKRAA